jgi:hypothetical protein
LLVRRPTTVAMMNHNCVYNQKPERTTSPLLVADQQETPKNILPVDTRFECRTLRDAGCWSGDQQRWRILGAKTMFLAFYVIE